jgi:hypothetical protein
MASTTWVPCPPIRIYIIQMYKIYNIYKEICLFTYTYIYIYMCVCVCVCVCVCNLFKKLANNRVINAACGDVNYLA